jgi:hypothetical protein
MPTAASISARPRAEFFGNGRQLDIEAGTPRFAAVVIITLALGTGANTAVFSVLNAVVLKPLPYEEPERLVRVYHRSGDDNGYLTVLAAVDYRGSQPDARHRRHLTDFGLKSSVWNQTFGATLGCHVIRPLFALELRVLSAEVVRTKSA